MNTRRRYVWILVLAGIAALAYHQARGARRLAADRHERRRSEQLDETLENSFPASDPPSWSPVTGTRSH